MGFNSMDVNDYISLLSNITKLDKKEVYVVVIKNLMAVNSGKMTPSDAYCNINRELTSQVTYKRNVSDKDTIMNKFICA